MQLGALSVSLAVKNISQKWLILKNGNALIGLFEGMFEQNIITFNPGWDENAQPVDPFDDVRQIQARLKESGISLTTETPTEGTGPGYITLTDPDGNQILIDQHR